MYHGFSAYLLYFCYSCFHTVLHSWSLMFSLFYAGSFKWIANTWQAETTHKVEWCHLAPDQSEKPGLEMPRKKQVNLPPEARGMRLRDCRYFREVEWPSQIKCKQCRNRKEKQKTYFTYRHCTCIGFYLRYVLSFTYFNGSISRNVSRWCRGRRKKPSFWPMLPSEQSGTMTWLSTWRRPLGRVDL